MKLNNKLMCLCITVIFIFLFLYWFIGNHENVSIPQFAKQKVALASGIAFETGEVVTIDPFTGKEIFPCGTTDNIFVSNNLPSTVGEQKKVRLEETVKRGNTSCNTQILNTDEAIKLTQLKEAIKSSEAPIKGMVRVNGEDKPARFFVTVSAVYLGSHCETHYHGGKQKRNCKTRQAECLALGLPHDC